MKLSIIIPAYNSSKYIKRCLDSILVEQSSNYEIICVNDGSIDQTLPILESYISPKIKVISQKNSGVSVARNTGLKHAIGEYVLFIDSDDFLSPNWYKLITETIKNDNNPDAVFFSKNTQHQIQKALMPQYICGIGDVNSFSTVWSKVYKMDVIKKHHIYFDQEVINGEDMLFNLKFNFNSKDIILDKGNFYNYCSSPNSATRNFNIRYIQSDIEFQQKLQTIINQYGREYAYIKDLCTINAWIALFHHYSYVKKFNFSEIKDFVTNPHYEQAIKRYNIYKSYFTKTNLIALWLFKHHQYRLSYYYIRAKRKLKPTKRLIERI